MGNATTASLIGDMSEYSDVQKATVSFMPLLMKFPSGMLYESGQFALNEKIRKSFIEHRMEYNVVIVMGATINRPVVLVRNPRPILGGFFVYGEAVRTRIFERERNVCNVERFSCKSI